MDRRSPLSASNEKRYQEKGDNMIELLWKDGQLVLHNQTSCSSPATIDEAEDASKSGGFLGNFMNMNQVEETASWFQNPLDNLLESEFEEFFSGVMNPDSINKVQRCVKFNSTKDTNGSQNSLMLPPKPHVYDSSSHSPSFCLNSSHQMKLGREEMSSFSPVASGSDSVMRKGEPSSMLSNESTICGSSQCPRTSNNDRVMEDFHVGLPQNCGPEMAFDPMNSSSSGGSVCRFRGAGKQTTRNHGHKRKERVLQESEHHIENVEQKSLEASKQAQKTAPSHRNRASELHNLSERRRRDRINEKLKALQDLIPHHYKSDKASMLEEAIGYLKSLQLQLQILWMGGGMAPMVFPGAQQYIPSMGVGMGFQSPVQLPGATLLNQFMPPFSAPNLPMVCPSLGIQPLRYPNQMPNVRLPEPFPCYFGFPRTQMPTQVKVKKGPVLKDTPTIL